MLVKEDKAMNLEHAALHRDHVLIIYKRNLDGNALRLLIETSSLFNETT